MLKTISKEELKEKIELHRLYLMGSDKGERLVLMGYDLSGSNIRNSDLRNSTLRYSNLSEVSLWGCNGNGKNIITLQTPYYHITYTDKVLQIGCEQHTIDQWFKFSDNEISTMDSKALEFWNKYKDWLKTTIELQPATPTGYKES